MFSPLERTSVLVFFYYSSNLGADDVRTAARSVSHGWTAEFGVAIHWKNLEPAHSNQVS